MTTMEFVLVVLIVVSTILTVFSLTDKRCDQKWLEESEDEK